MQQITHGYRGLSLLVDLNWDRMFYPAAILVALMLGAFVAA